MMGNFQSREVRMREWESVGVEWEREKEREWEWEWGDREELRRHG